MIKVVIISNGESDYEYAFEDGSTMQREEGETPNGNELYGRWVYRAANGEMVDYDKYRGDLCERNNLNIHNEELS